MIPENFVDTEITAYGTILPRGGLIVDGGNTDYRKTLKHAEELSLKGIDLIDVGTSGGILGLTNGFSLMVGGSEPGYARVKELLDIMAAPNGATGHVGPTGTGHYVKMIHNGIEYGVMQALAEGYALLNNGPIQPIPLAEVARIWQNGSIIESTLNNLALDVLTENATLDDVDGYVADSGEGRWTLETAHTAEVQLPALEAALAVRKQSQSGQVSYATKLLAALRNKFGGHAINKQA
jgi:6-phosphogluconate dehydrogenase